MVIVNQDLRFETISRLEVTN